MAGDLNFKVNFDTAQAGVELQGLLQRFVDGSEAAGNKLNRALGGTTERKVVIRTQVNEAGIKGLTSQVVTLRSEADKLKNAFVNATRVDRGSITSLNQQISQAIQARNSIKQFDQAVDLANRKQVLSAKQTQEFIDADNKVKILQQSLRNLQDADKGLSGRLASSFGDLLEKGRKLQDIVVIFQSIGIAVAAFTGPIKAATAALSDLDQFRLSFQAIGQGADASSGALADASRIALGLGVNIKTVREGFQQLAPVVLNTGGTLNDVSAITESLSSRFAAFGLSSEKSRRVLNGIIQAFGKGKLQAEELTQQISEADPAFKTDLAKALLTAKNELGALGREVDGTTANLEGLVKQGKITADVLRKVIPELSKSDILFGKLGPTAGTALEAFKRGRQGLDAVPVTLRQVQTNIENINQLNLEKFSKIGEPIVVSFLEIQGAITDFITRLADIGATKDLVTIFAAVASSIGNTVKVIASFIEGISRVISIVSPLLVFLSKIPGLTELIGIALIARFLKPVVATTKAVLNLGKAFSDLGKTRASISSATLLVDPRQSEVTRKSLEQLRKELEKPVESGIEKSLKSVNTAFGSVTQTTGKLTSRQVKQLEKIDSAIQVEIDHIKDWQDEVASVQSKKIKQKKLMDAGGIDVINAKIFETQDQIKQVESALADLDKGWQATAEAESRAAQVSATLSDDQIANIKRRLALEEELTDLRGKYANNTSEMARANKRYSELEKANKDVDEQRNIIKGLAKQRAELDNSIYKVGAELTTLGGNVDKTSAEFDLYSRAVQGAASSPSKFISNSKAAGSSATELTQRLEVLRSTLAKLEQNKILIETTIDTDQVIADAQEEFDYSAKEIEKLKSKRADILDPASKKDRRRVKQLDQVNSKIEEITAAAGETRKQIKRLENNIEVKARAKIEYGDIDTVNAKLKEMSDLAEEVKYAMDRVGIGISDEEISSMQKRIDLEDELANATKKVEDIKQQRAPIVEKYYPRRNKDLGDEEIAQAKSQAKELLKVQEKAIRERDSLQEKLKAAGGPVDRTSQAFTDYTNALGLARKESFNAERVNQLLGKSFNSLEDDLNALTTEIAKFKQAKFVLEYRDPVPELDDQITKLESQRRQLKKLGSQKIKLETATVSPAAPEAVGLQNIDTRNIQTVNDLMDEFKKRAKATYVSVALNSEDYVQAVRKEIEILDQRIAKLKEQRKSATALPVARGPRDMLLDLTKRSDDLKSSLAQLGASFERNLVGIEDYANSLVKIDAGARLSRLELSKLTLASEVYARAVASSNSEIRVLTAQQSNLSARVKQLGLELGKLPAFDLRAPNIKQELKAAKDQLAQIVSQLNAATSAGELLQSESELIDTALQRAGENNKPLQSLKNTFKDLSESPNALARSFGRLGLKIGGTLSSLKAALKGFSASIKALAPELLFFAAIAVAVSAYSKATEAARKVQESNQASLQSLESTVQDLTVSYTELTGKVEDSDFKKLTPQFSGVEVVLASLGGAIVKIIGLFKTLFDAIKGVTVDPITGQVKKTYNAFEQLGSAILAIGSATAIGSRFGPWGAGIAFAASTALVLTAALNDTGAKIDYVKQQGQALREGYAKEIELTRQLASQIELLGQEYLKSRQAAEASGKKSTGSTDGGATQMGKDIQIYSKLISSYGTLVQRYKSLQAQQQGYLRNVRQGDQLAFRLRNEIRLMEGKAAALRSSGSTRDDILKAEDITRQIGAKEKQVKVIEAANAESAASERMLKAEIMDLEKELNRLSKEYGLLSKEELATANNTSNLEAKLKDTRSALELLDFDKQREQFDKVAVSIGTIQAQIERIENAGKERTLAGYVAEIKKQLAGNQIPTSLANIQKLVESLEQRSLLLDINSPELPKVLQDLLKAQEYTNQLDGKKAVITLQLIEKGLQEGSLKDTLALRERKLAELAKVKQSSPINSKEYVKALEQERQLNMQKRADEQATDELRASIAEKQLSRIDEIAQRERAAHDRRISQLDKERERIEKIYDAQIKTIEDQVGPNEQQLEVLKRQELLQKASQGGRAGLEARAELERIAREEQLAELKKKKEEELQKIADKKAALEEQNREKEEALLQRRLAIEETIAAIRGKSIDEEIAAMQKTLEQRGVGMTKTPTTGATVPVPGGEQSAVDTARKAGEQAGRAYSQGYTMTIERADTPTNDPAAKVKYDYQDPGVIQAQKERNSLEVQYQRLLNSTQQLEAKAAGMGGNLDPSLAGQLSLNYQQLSNLQNDLATSEQKYADALQSTKTITGEIVLNNRSFANTFSSFQNKKPAVPVDPAVLSQAYALTQRLNQQWDAQGAKIRGLNAELNKTTDPTKRQALIQSINTEGQKLDQIKSKTFQARDAYGELRQQAIDAGQEQILPDNTEQIKKNIQDWASGISSASDSSKVLDVNITNIADKSGVASEYAAKVAGAFNTASEAISGKLIPAIAQVKPELDAIQTKMNNIFGKEYTVSVNLKTNRQGLWTGGPATGGTVYKVNELGQEGFMNKFGKITPIRKPRFGNWRAPSDGFVIPADVFSQINTKIPRTDIKHSKPSQAMISGGSRSGNKMLSMAFAQINSISNANNNLREEIARSNATQTMEIGKLTRAIGELVDKDWNVDVNIKNSNNKSVAYMNALNRMI